MSNVTPSAKTLVLRPRLSEKTFGLASSRTVYVFDVPKAANKHAVSAAVAAQFEVTVMDVNILNSKGKPKSSPRKGHRPVQGQRSDFKKAYVTLKEGDKLPFFDEPEADKKSKKEAKKESSDA